MECLNERDEVVTMVMKKIVQNLERQKARKGQQKWEGDGSSSFGDANTLDQSLPDVNDSLLEQLLEENCCGLFVDTSNPTDQTEG